MAVKVRIGWLCDAHAPVGGAELTQAEFAAAAPEGVEIVSVPHNELERLSDCDRAVVFNCVTYPPETARALVGKEVTRYFNDLDPHSDPELREALLKSSARWIFTSPLHLNRFPHGLPLDAHSVRSVHTIPPALDLQRFRPTRQIRRNGKREGTVCVGTFLGPGKGGHLIAEWAEGNGGVDIYGHGGYAPPEGPQTRHLGLVTQTDLPQTLWKYERFVHLPTVVEPFGRAVVEAWAAGCKLIVNGLVGARYWIEEAPEKLESASEDFWKVVLE